jgi:ATP-dependent Clp protease ATP-binding subunit ClpC
MGLASKTATRAMRLANEAAGRSGSDSIDTEHLLLGMIEEGSGVAIAVLKAVDVDPQEIRQRIEDIIHRGPIWPESRKLPQTRRCKRAVEYGLLEAEDLYHKQQGHKYLGTEHVLLGLIRESDGVAGQVLRSLGVQLEDCREAVIRLGLREA